MTLQIENHPFADLATSGDTALLTEEYPQKSGPDRLLRQVCIVLSMLHEPETPALPNAPDNSATRKFLGQRVLGLTLSRLNECMRENDRLRQAAIVCWDDQLAAVRGIATEFGAQSRSIGPRQPGPWLNAWNAARRWADGWRGGLLGTCEFDRGFHVAAIDDLAHSAQADAVLLVDPASAFVNAELIDAVFARADSTPALDLFFAPAAPGLCGVLLRTELLDQLVDIPPNIAHPGRYLHYLPEAPHADPIAGDGCAAIPAALARTSHRFTIDSARQARRLERAVSFVSARGQLPAEAMKDVAAEQLLAAMNQMPAEDEVPREVVLEINTQRVSKPVFSPAGRLAISRPDMSIAQAAAIFKEIAAADDMRLTISGVGDPILSPHFVAIAHLAQAAGIHAVRVETDLLGCDRTRIAELAAAPIDIVSVQLPAVTPRTYAAVMGVDAMLQAVSNLRELILQRQVRKSGTPIIVPVFTKCQQNLGEMEAWYDQWLHAVGSATIVGPSDFAGQIADCAVADMTPARRTPCRRLDRRMMILSDGSIVSCEQDILGRRILGKVGEHRIADVWSNACNSLRTSHAAGKFGEHPLCGRCREWHRP